MPIPILRRMQAPKRRGLARAAAMVTAAGLLALAFSRVDLTPGYAALQSTLLSGPGDGNYHALGEQLAAHAAAQDGRLLNAATDGSRENLERLASDAHGACTAHFALAQAGLAPPEGAGLELIGRLPRSEVVFILGRAAGRLRSLADLKGLAIGIGPERSGTAELARALFAQPDLQGLGVRLVNQPAVLELEQLTRGELDLGFFVTDESAALVGRAIRERGLEMASLDGLEGLARRFPALSVERLAAGRYDSVRPLPATDRQVLRVDTLLVANRCAHRAERVAMLVLLAAELPDFVARNQGRSSTPGMPLAVAARQFFVSGEPDFADRYLPWLVNVMPPTNWVYVVMTFSVLFNAMSIGNRFRLWRVDQRRERLDDRAGDLWGHELTYAQIRALDPAVALGTAATRAAANLLLDDFLALRRTCHAQASSLLVPMGQEMSYRYQEALIEEAIAALAALMPERVGPRPKQAAG
jgi:hypothetical protein